jgi:hypothetical protein
MELEELWNSDKGSTAPEEIRIPLRQRLPLPVEKIKKALDINLVFAVLSSFLYIYALTKFHNAYVVGGFFILIAGHIWGLRITLNLRKNIVQYQSSAHSLLETLQKTAAAVRRWIYISEYSGIVLYPVAIATGFIAGGLRGSGLPVEVFMGKPYVIIAFSLSIAFLVPLCFVMTRVIMKLSFMKYLVQLEKDIRTFQDV